LIVNKLIRTTAPKGYPRFFVYEMKGVFSDAKNSGMQSWYQWRNKRCDGEIDFFIGQYKIICYQYRRSHDSL